MVWTRLFYIKNLETAINSKFSRYKPQQLLVTPRYKNILKKQFRANGVPWIYQKSPIKPHIRDQKPKKGKQIIAKQLRLAKIQKALLECDEKQLQYRQTRLNNRKPKGIDKIIQKALPSWIKPDNSQKIPQYFLKRSGNEQ